MGRRCGHRFVHVNAGVGFFRLGLVHLRLVASQTQPTATQVLPTTACAAAAAAANIEEQQQGSEDRPLGRGHQSARQDERAHQVERTRRRVPQVAHGEARTAASRDRALQAAHATAAPATAAAASPALHQRTSAASRRDNDDDDDDDDDDARRRQAARKHVVVVGGGGGGIGSDAGRVPTPSVHCAHGHVGRGQRRVLVVSRLQLRVGLQRRPQSSHVQGASRSSAYAIELDDNDNDNERRRPCVGVQPLLFWRAERRGLLLAGHPQHTAIAVTCHQCHYISISSSNSSGSSNRDSSQWQHCDRVQSLGRQRHNRVRHAPERAGRVRALIAASLGHHQRLVGHARRPPRQLPEQREQRQ